MMNLDQMLARECQALTSGTFRAALRRRGAVKTSVRIRFYIALLAHWLKRCLYLGAVVCLFVSALAAALVAPTVTPMTYIYCAVGLVVVALICRVVASTVQPRRRDVSSERWR